jgi:hypothetical protein
MPDPMDIRTSPETREAEMRARNRRTGLVLASIALAFFVGVILKYTVFR